MNFLNRFGAAALPAAITLLATLQVAVKDNIVTSTEGGQLIAAFAAVTLTWFVPLAKGRWAGLFKTGISALGAVATLIIPLIIGFTWDAGIILALAVLNVIATETGVNLRDSARNGRHELVKRADAESPAAQL